MTIILKRKKSNEKRLMGYQLVDLYVHNIALHVTHLTLCLFLKRGPQLYLQTAQDLFNKPMFQIYKYLIYNSKYFY